MMKMEQNTSIPSVIDKLNDILKLSLTNVILIIPDQLTADLEIHQTVIFKVLSDQNFRRAQIKESMAIAWNMKEENKISMYGDKLF